MNENQEFTAAEEKALQPHFTDAHRTVFALTNLPETVKGALFARYSRSPRSLRRLWLEEFRRPGDNSEDEGSQRAEELYRKILGDYGDDSVAQLGSGHVACEGISNVLTKVLERGRLMSYLEQSTRYIPYTDRPGGRWRYVTPVELRDAPVLAEYEEVMNLCFETYSKWLPVVQDELKARFPKTPEQSAGAWKRAIRAKALDAVRGLLPAATKSNVGIHGSGQAFETLLNRLLANPLNEASEIASSMLNALVPIMGAFLQRVERPDRGGVTQEYRRERQATAQTEAERLDNGHIPRRQEAEDSTRLLEYDPQGETKVLAQMLYEQSDWPGTTLLEYARGLPAHDRRTLLLELVGDRKNRRNRPGRAFEHTSYTFEVVGDYGAFRDLQRHRMLTIEWQRLTAAHGPTPASPVIQEIPGCHDAWRRVMNETAAVHEKIRKHAGATVAQYAVPMAYRIRFIMRMNAAQAMHMIELRTQRAGHWSYRKVCHQMHALIRNTAGHRGIAEAMKFVDYSTPDLGRLKAEERSEARNRQ